LKITEVKEDGGVSIWEQARQKLFGVPELVSLVKNPTTLYYNNDIDTLSPSFSLTQLDEMITKCEASDDNPFPTILIVPSTYYLDKGRPVGVQLQVEGEFPSLWLLHKSDIKEGDSYFEQLKVDIQKANEICDHLKQGIELIPSLHSTLHYRFFTSASNGSQLCYEIPISQLDAYLQKGNQPWIIRTESSVAAEIALKRREFPLWEEKETALVEKKEKKRSLDPPEQKVGEGLGFGDPAREEKSVDSFEKKNREIYAQAQRYGTMKPQLRVPFGTFLKGPPPLPSTTASATATPEAQSGLEGKQQEREHKDPAVPTPSPPRPPKEGKELKPIQKLFYRFRQAVNTNAPPWIKDIGRLADKQNEANPNEVNSNGVLYFALAIVTVVALGLVAITIVCVTKNKRRKKALKQQSPEYQSPQPYPLYPAVPKPGEYPASAASGYPYAQTAYEDEQKRDPPPRANHREAVDHYYDLPNSPRGSDADVDAESADEERSLIDQKLTEQNRYFPQAQRSEYTHEDMEQDKTYYEYLDQYSKTKLAHDLEQSLGFPKSSRACTEGACGIPSSVHNKRISF
jgi:hypothetical protein